MAILDALGKVYRETGIWVPKLLRFGRQRCCYITVDPCPNCQSETTPTQWSVTFADFIEDGCGDCDSLNNTFILAPRSECVWVHGFNPHICGNNVIIYIGLAIHLGGLQVSIYYTAWGNPWVRFNKVYSIPMDCQSVTNQDIPFQGEYADPNLGCDHTAATCEVTAL